MISPRPLQWWAAAAGILLATTVWIRATDNGVPVFDHAGLTLANAWRSPGLDGFFLGLTWIGSLMVLLPLVLAVGIGLWRRGFRGEAGFLVAALLGAALLAQLLKQFSLRLRPDLFPALTAVASPLSFPSAHAVQVTAAAVSLLLIAVRFSPNCWRWALPLMLLGVSSVALSRIYLQVHYPSDVLAGILSAGCWVAGLHSCLPLPGCPQEEGEP